MGLMAWIPGLWVQCAALENVNTSYMTSLAVAAFGASHIVA